MKEPMELKAYAPGIYPRSEALVQATRDLDRGRIGHEEVDQLFEDAFANFVAAQEQAGLSPLSTGLLSWQDHFRPLVEHSDGLEARPLTRFLDTNTFYRGVLVEGEPRLRSPVPGQISPAGPWLATLPSPYAFSRATDGAASAQALAANVLAPQIQHYADEGYALIVLQDPFLARGGDVSEAAAALSELPQDVPLVLQLPFADAGPVLEEVADAPVTAVGIDFYATSLDAIPADYPKEMVAGVVDARSSAIEDAAEIARFLDRLLQRKPAAVSLSVNGDLQFVPEPIARRKLAALGTARTELAEAA